MGCNHYNTYRWIDFVNTLEPIHSFVSGIDAGFKIHIKQNSINGILLNKRNQVVRTFEGEYLLELFLKKHFKCDKDTFIIINNQDSSFHVNNLIN